MSYSFNVRGADKEAARAAVAAELDKVVAQQPIHEADRDQAAAAADAMLDLIPDPAEGEEVSVTVNGSLGWRGLLGEGHTITSATCNASASILTKTA
jgi:hypothetical protein